MWGLPTTSGHVRVRVSSRDDGDFNLDVVDRDVLEQRRRALVDLPWTMLDERHGTDVVYVDAPGSGDRCIGDVAITSVPRAVLGAWVGDCVPVVLVSRDGVMAAVHAGWRGLAAGIVDRAIDAIDAIDVGDVGDVGDAGAAATLTAFVGPSLHGCCNEFGRRDLEAVAAGTGCAAAAITGSTRWGTISLDAPAAVRGALARRGVVIAAEGPCTGCDARYYSHRMRGELQRHVVAVWKDAA